MKKQMVASYKGLQSELYIHEKVQLYIHEKADGCSYTSMKRQRVAVIKDYNQK